MTHSVRFRLDLAYDGTAFQGWQVQPGCRTVQGVLEETLGKLSQQIIKLHGSGRTDQGVHARQQVAHFDWDPGRFTPETIGRAVNAQTDPDVRILNVKAVPDTFHARKSVLVKEYRYFIWNAPVVPPYIRHIRCHIRRELDIPAMRQAAGLLTGNHDFSSFTANPRREVESHIRNLMELTVRKRGPEIEIIAKSNGFLYKMVRSIVGHLLRVGEGAVQVGETREILESKQRTARVETAPPHGLFLWKVIYPKPF